MASASPLPGAPVAPGLGAPAPGKNGPTPGVGTAALSSAPLPTWVALDWAAFPTDPGPSYTVRGRTWTVATAGNDLAAGTDAAPLASIAAALDHAQPGDLVRVRAGTYAEGKPGSNRALVMAQDGVTLTAAPGETVTVEPASSEQRFGLVLEGSQLVVNGINFSGFHPAIHFGLATRTQRGVVISNLRVDAKPGIAADGIVNYADTSSLGFPSIDGLLIKNVTVAGAGLSISCNSGPCRSLRFQDVRVLGGSGTESSGADGIAVERGDNLLFQRVEVSGVSADGIDTKATRVVVWDSHVHDVGRNGIKLWWGGDIVNTSIHGTGADGALIIKSGERVRLLHDTIADVGKDGESYAMTVRYDDNGPIQIEIVNSIIASTSGSAYLSSAGTVSIRNSLFFGSRTGVLLSHGQTQITQAAGAAGLVGYGAGNLVADPLLDATKHPGASSPAVNAGVAAPSLYPAEDLAGGARVKGSAPDLGAFEVR